MSFVVIVLLLLLWLLLLQHCCYYAVASANFPPQSLHFPHSRINVASAACEGSKIFVIFHFVSGHTALFSLELGKTRLFTCCVFVSYMRFSGFCFSLGMFFPAGEIGG